VTVVGRPLTMGAVRAKWAIQGDEYAVLRGLIEGNEVEVLGNAFNMEGTGPAGAKRKIALSRSAGER
jgi:hypothetical protein